MSLVEKKVEEFVVRGFEWLMSWFVWMEVKVC
jgi:hypothetical protein